MKMNALKQKLKLVGIGLLAACTSAYAQTATEVPQGFVEINQCSFLQKGKRINIDRFEILDHPVTNREYKYFTDATSHPVPPHWKNGAIPQGKEEYPVVFVNRNDAMAYIDWLTNQDNGRVYRLPSRQEYIIATLGGKDSKIRYFWGNDENVLRNTNQVNFNIDGKRRFNEWERYLKPARWGRKNSAGLYQMAGNVWQWACDFEDPASLGFKYRIEKPHEPERCAMGGSWASSKDFLMVGVSASQSPGNRHPDVGIRLVRAPKGVDWHIENRNVAVVPNGEGKVTISWALLPTDTKETHFNVYCIKGKERGHKGEKLNKQPLYNTTFAYDGLKKGERYQFSVVSLDANSKELRHSEWTGILAGEFIHPVVAKFKPIMAEGSGIVPIFGNLEGIGKLNCVMRLDNRNKETSQDPGLPVQLEAFSHTGKSLWRKNIATHDAVFGSAMCSIQRMGHGW